MGRKGPMTISPSAKAELLRRIAALGDELDTAEAECERVQGERDRLYRSLRRMADGMHAGVYDDARAALDEATALLGELDPP